MKGRRDAAGRPVEPAVEGEPFRPLVGASESIAEFTVKGVAAGIVFGILFGAANAYLGLRAGLTISTSIPVAVMTVALFRAFHFFGRPGTILEANTSQTVGSASSSVASGVIFTLPALFLWGLDPTIIRMTMLALFGGLLGVLFMIPLRRFLIEKEHGNLPYPEGTACAEVLAASEAGGAKAANVFFGLGVGALFQFLVGWIHLFPGKVHMHVPLLKKGELGINLSGALFGVGYILGPRIGAVMVGGGLLSWLVIIPIIAMWGEGRADPLYPETVKQIADMDAHLIWHCYVRYIGAGAVATAGLITLVRSIPTMVESFRIGTRTVRERIGEGVVAKLRTSDDLPLRFVLVGAAVIAIGMAVVPHVFGGFVPIGLRLAGALLVILFAFFFVTVASRIVGLVGVTSNPTSGMTIASLLGTSSVFLMLGWTGDVGKVAALSVGCVVAIAASISGDTSQDLKTGFLLGATPRKQQIGELVGVLTSAFFVCLAVLLLDRAYGFGTDELPAPQATLMKLVIEGVLQQSLPWIFICIGALIAIIAELLRIPSLPFAVGVYLPVTTMVPVFLGGALRWSLKSTARDREDRDRRRTRGVLFGSGLVGGEGLLGVGIAAFALWKGKSPAGIGPEWAGGAAPLVGLAAFLFLILVFRWRCGRSGG